MTTTIEGSAQALSPTTNYSKSFVVGTELPPGGPQPAPTTIQSAISDSNLQADSFTASQAASILLSASALAPAPPAPASDKAATSATPSVSAGDVSTQAPVSTTHAQDPTTAVVAQTTTSNPSPVQQFEQNQGPPPYTLQSAQPDPARDNSQSLHPAVFSPFQIRQFSDFVRTLHSITSAVLPNFSFSA